jgi:uncharacterized membrane protein
MRHVPVLAFAIFTLAAIAAPTCVMAQDKSAKTCRMEQQCHWENFKKICVYVKVCR